MNPLTSSDSASGRSNGVRLSSARAEIRYIMKSGNRGTMNQIDVCASTIVVKFSEPARRITAATQVEKISS